MLQQISPPGQSGSLRQAAPLGVVGGTGASGQAPSEPHVSVLGQQTSPALQGFVGAFELLFEDTGKRPQGWPASRKGRYASQYWMSWHDTGGVSSEGMRGREQQT